MKHAPLAKMHRLPQPLVAGSFLSGDAYETKQVGRSDGELVAQRCKDQEVNKEQGYGSRPLSATQQQKKKKKNKRKKTL